MSSPARVKQARESELRAELEALDEKRAELERVRRGRELMAYQRRIALEQVRRP